MRTEQLKIEIKKETWHITLCDTGQVSFAYSVPYEKSKQCTDPLWFDWDYTPYKPELVWNATGITTNISPFLLKEKIMNGVVNLINKSKVEFFYFQSTTKQRGNVYSGLLNLLSSKLVGKWESQVIEKKWFYFNKIQ